MLTITRFKAAAVSIVAAAASLSALAVATAGPAAAPAAQAAGRSVAQVTFCIPCLEPCGPVCFETSRPAQEALRSAAGSPEIARLS